MNTIDEHLVERMYRRGNGERWRAPRDRFARALQASAARTFGDRSPDAKELERYLASLHLEDLALACSCAAGDDEAWEHFVREHRPLLYRAADAIDPSGGARDLADSLYADLFGMQNGATERRPLFAYFHGRSSLITWLRALLVQRHVDRIRAGRRLEGLPDDDSVFAIAAPAEPVDPDRYRDVDLLRPALHRAIAALPSRDRLRLACYYGQHLTLAETGHMLGEHEATASRGLARTRAAIRASVETQLRDAGLAEAQIARCFETVSDNPGPLDLSDLLDMNSGPPARKKRALDRSP